MNIKQATNYDYPPGGGTVSVGALTEGAHKISFCCEPKGIGQSIVIVNEFGSSQAIEIGKTGMIEYQEEPFKNINDSEAETENVTPSITAVTIPGGFK